MNILTPLIRVHGDPANKEKYVNRLKQHRKAATLIQVLKEAGK